MVGVGRLACGVVPPIEAGPTPRPTVGAAVALAPRPAGQPHPLQGLAVRLTRAYGGPQGIPAKVSYTLDCNSIACKERSGHSMDCL